MIVVLSASQQLMTQGAGLPRMLCGCQEEREKRQRKNTEKSEENAEQRGRKEDEAFIEKDAMWHRQQDRDGKHSHLSTPPLLSNQTPRIRERLQQAGRTKHWEEQSGLRGRRGDINAFLRENRVVRFHSNLLVALRGGTGYQHGFISFISDH